MKAFRQTAPRHRQIMQLLARAYPMPMTIEAIALEVGLSPGRCAHIMNAMRMANRVIRVGYWNGGQQGTAAMYGSALGASVE